MMPCLAHSPAQWASLAGRRSSAATPAHGVDALPVRRQRARLAQRVQRVNVVQDLADRQADLAGLVLAGKGLDLADEGHAPGVVPRLTPVPITIFLGHPLPIGDGRTHGQTTDK